LLSLSCPHDFEKITDTLGFYYTRERWIWDYFIVSNAARMALDAGNDEIILLFNAREYSMPILNLIHNPIGLPQPFVACVCHARHLRLLL
jgi:hypothetical protein